MVALGSPVVPEVKPSSATSSRPVCTAWNLTDLLSATRSSSASWLAVPSKLIDLLQEAAVLGACHQLVGDAAVAQRETDLGLVDDLGELAGAQHRHGVDGHGAGLGHRQPRRHHGGVVARPDQHAVARLDAEVLHQRVRQPVAPVGQLLVGAAAAVADQRGVVAEALLHHPVGQLDGGVEVFGILELRPVQQQVGPLLGRRQVVAREGVDVRAGTEDRRTLGADLRAAVAAARANILPNISCSYLPLPIPKKNGERES